jgi:branched-chain amino acid transport system ATP-binding protein
VLELRGVSAAYARAQVLFDVTLQAGAGELVVLLGRNGAGKSTTLKTIMGLVRRSAGEIRYGGARIDALEPFRVARLGVGYVPEERRIFGSLTVAENLEAGRQPPRGGTPEWTFARLAQLFPNLAALRDRPGARMSGGEQQMLAIARTLMGNPRAILLDEPSEGLAPLIVDQLVRAIHTLKEQGLCILLSEQNLHFALEVADRAYIIEKGHIRFGGTIAELQANESISAQYLAL